MRKRNRSGTEEKSNSQGHTFLHRNTATGENINASNKMGFYKAFEDRFRGTREDIKARLEFGYSDLLQIFGFDKGRKKAIDLGCGRGEWLEILQEIDFEPQGVDLDDGMLSQCYELGLPVKKADVVEFLKAQKSESFHLISGFHVAEHLPFQKLRELVKESLRVLVPGGILILETPNPENIVVAGNYFYLDPTHERPIPPGLLGFVVEYTGFKRNTIIRLQSKPELSDKGDVTVSDLLEGVSPDYAVVGQKAGEHSLLSNFDRYFNTIKGLDLETLSNRYEVHQKTVVDQLASRIKFLEKGNADEIARASANETRAVAAESRAAAQEIRAVSAEVQLEQLRSRAEHAEALFEATSKDLQELHTANHNHWLLAESRLQDINETLRRAEAAEAVAADQGSLSQQYGYELSEAKDRIKDLEQNHRNLLSEYQYLQSLASDWHKQIELLKASASFRITAPLRILKMVMVRVLRVIKSLMLSFLRWLVLLTLMPFIPFMLLMVPFVNKSPSLRFKLRKIIALNPELETILKSLMDVIRRYRRAVKKRLTFSKVRQFQAIPEDSRVASYDFSGKQASKDSSDELGFDKATIDRLRALIEAGKPEP